MKSHRLAGLELVPVQDSSAQPGQRHSARRWPLLVALLVLMLATLACRITPNRSSLVAERIATRTPWPTFTPPATSTPPAVALAAAEVVPTPTVQAAAPSPTFTPPPTFTPVPVSQPLADQGQVATPAPPTPTPPATATRAPLPTPTPTQALPAPAPVSLASSPAPVADSAAGGWSFVGTWVEAQPARKLAIVFGELVNNTGATQKISQVTGTFYDSQGQLIAADKSTTGLWPTQIIPAGGRVPFALTVYGVQDVARFDLVAHANAVGSNARQDFEFVSVTEAQKGTRYCLAGAVKNPGGETANSLVIAAVFYDPQGNMLRFGTDNAAGLAAGQSVNFEVCLKSPPENSAGYALRAWGL